MCTIGPVNRSVGDEELVRQFLGPLMETMDRGNALDEATFAAMETVVFLMRASDADDIELIREALASARATVVAAGYALTSTTDAERVQKNARPA
jgi:hypothetical protein